MSTLLLFKDYLQHLGMVALATIVAMLACTLKGTCKKKYNMQTCTIHSDLSDYFSLGVCIGRIEGAGLN